MTNPVLGKLITVDSAQRSLQQMENLHCAVVEFGIGDSAAKELGVETVHADNVPLAEANAIGSYLTDTATKEEKTCRYNSESMELEWYGNGKPDKTSGKHRVLLDLDVPHTYVPSSTEGHGHLVIDVPQDWDDLRKLLQLLGDMKILQYGFVDATTARTETWLRAPGIKKDDPMVIGISDSRN